MKKGEILLILIVQFLFQFSFGQNLCTNFNLDKGIYVDGFFRRYSQEEADVLGYDTERAKFNASILGNPIKEKALLEYAVLNNINYLILYGNSVIFESNGSDIHMGYEELLANFIVKANQTIVNGKPILVGLTFGANSKDIFGSETFPVPPLNDLVNYTRSDVISKLDGDTNFSAWGTWSNLIKSTPEAEIGINKQIYALASLRKLDRQIEDIKTSFNFDENLGDVSITLVSESEWWNVTNREIEDNELDSDVKKYNYKRDVKFPEFNSLLKAMYAYKNDPSSTVNIERVDVYQSILPNLPEPAGGPDPQYDAENESQKVSWVEEFTEFTDRLLLTNYVSTEGGIATHRSYDEELERYDDNSVNDNLELSPLFNAASDKFGGLNGQGEFESGDPGFGDLMADFHGKSTQEIQEIFYNRYNGYKTADRVGNKIHLKGFQWFSYSIMPFMIYSNDFNESGKLITPNNQDYFLDDNLNHYFFDKKSNDVANFEVFNPVRSPFGNSPSSETNGFNLSWRKYDENLSNYTSLGLGAKTQYTGHGVYLITTADNSGCFHSSVPVLGTNINKDVFIKSHVNDQGSEGQFYDYYWESPSILVNQSEFDHTTDGDAWAGTVYENWVHVKINNKGDINSDGADLLSVYFANASLSQDWPRAWFNARENPNGGNSGDRINLHQVYSGSVPKKQNGVNGEKFVDIFWEDSDYDIAVKDFGEFGSTEDEAYKADRHYCILARLERSEYGSFGMTHPETTALWRNVTYNNNVAQKNVTFLDQSGELTAGNGGIRELDGFTSWNTALIEFGNYSSQSVNAKITFEKVVGQTNFQKDGELLVNLGSKLFQKWKKGGMKGSGVSVAKTNLINGNANILDVVGDSINSVLSEIITTIKIDSANAWIGNIDLDSSELFNIYTGSLINSSNVQSAGIYTYKMTHQNSIGANQHQLVGGQTFKLNYSPCPGSEISKVSINGESTLFVEDSQMGYETQYEWYQNGVRMVNQNTGLLKPSQSGVYYAKVIYPSLSCITKTESVRVDVEENHILPGSGKMEGSNGTIRNQFEKFELFPNPTSNNIKLSCDGIKEGVYGVRIFNAEGKRVLFKEIELKDGKEFTFEVKEFSNGLYYFQIGNNSFTGGKIFFKKD